MNQILGQARQVDGRVWLDVELVTFPDRKHLWSHGFTQPAADWDIVRSQIAREVTTRLDLAPTAADQTLLRRPLSQSPDALKAYYRGRNSFEVLEGAT